MKDNRTIPEIKNAIDIINTIPNMSPLTKQRVADYTKREMLNDIKLDTNINIATQLNETHINKIYARKAEPTYFYIPLSFYARSEDIIEFKCHKYHFDKHMSVINIDSISTLHNQEFDDVFEEISIDDIPNRLSKCKFINNIAVVNDIKEKLNKIEYGKTTQI